ncbi:MAG: c-type cytochrome [Dehalococcoidia bacterium]|nr:c-type cytochrome [Dehalococcoidia bacterium]
MDMRKWEILGIISVVAVLVGLPVAVFGYQGYREAQEGPGLAARPASVSVPAGDPAGGRQVYLGKCASCHGQVGEGSVAGPDITNMSVGALFVYAWILDPSGVTPIATMPKIPLTEKEAADVTTYVVGLKDGKTLADIVPSQQKAAPPSGAGGEAAKQTTSSTAGDAAKGKIVFASKSCGACHGPNGEGTAAAPRLKGAPADAVKAQVRSPKGTMPAFGPGQISDSELQDLIAFMDTLK